MEDRAEDIASGRAEVNPRGSVVAISPQVIPFGCGGNIYDVVNVARTRCKPELIHVLIVIHGGGDEQLAGITRS